MKVFHGFLAELKVNGFKTADILGVGIFTSI